jgi:hypothetical protein
MSNNDFYKIIAIRFGSKIMFGQSALDMIAALNDYDQIISLAEFKMMAKMDLGDKWGKHAETAPVLFELPVETPFNLRNPNPYNHRII